MLTPEGRAAALDLLIKAGRIQVMGNLGVATDLGGDV
jgi:hypothetical protein